MESPQALPNTSLPVLGMMEWRSTHALDLLATIAETPTQWFLAAEVVSLPKTKLKMAHHRRSTRLSIIMSMATMSLPLDLQAVTPARTAPFNKHHIMYNKAFAFETMFNLAKMFAQWFCSSTAIMGACRLLLLEVFLLLLLPLPD